MTVKHKGNLLPMIITFSLGWAIIYADRTALYPLLGVIETDLGLTGTQTGFITTTYFLIYVAMQVPAGLLGDRWGLKRLLVIMYFLAGLPLLLLGILPVSYYALLLLVGLHGLGAGAYYPAAYGITLQEVPADKRGLSAAIINSGQTLGLGLGLASAGPLYLATGSWRYPFLLLALPTLVMVFIFHLAVHKGVSSPQQERFPLRKILADRNLMSINLALFCSLYGFWVAVTWGAAFFQEERGLGLGLAGLYMAIIALAALPAGITTSFFSDRLGRKRFSLLLFPLAALTVFLLAFVHSLPALIVALIAYGLFGKFAWDPIAIAWTGDHAARLSNEAMGAAVGVFNFAGMSSAVVAPLVSGIIRDLTGSLEGAFYLGAAVVLLGTLFVMRVEET